MTTKKTVARLRAQIRTMIKIMEAFPDKHMKFGVIDPLSGAVEEPTKCADWCYACKLQKLQADVNEWKTHEARARGFGMQLAQTHGHSGNILAHIQAGQYDEAITAIRTREEQRHTRTGRTVVSVIAVEEGGKLDCCDEEQFHVWVTVLTWSGRRAYLTGASPFIAAVGETVIEDVNDLTGVHFYADLPFEPPPAMPEPGEHLEWPNLELTPPTEEIERQLGLR